MMRRVLIVTRFFVRAGTETFLMNNFRHIDRNRFHLDFLVLNGDESPFREEIERLGGSMVFGHANLAVVKEVIPSIRKIYRIMRRGNYDVVHANCDLVNGCVLLAARMAGIRTRLSHSHNTDFKEGGGALRRLFYNRVCPWLIRRCATKLLACGQQAGIDLYCRDWRGRPSPVDFTVIHNGIDVERFLQAPTAERMAALRQELSIPEGVRVYGNISRYDEQKNLIYAVEIFQAIHKEDQQAVFILGGIDGPMKEAVVRKITVLGLDHVVREVGERTDLPDLLQLMDCFVLPSLFEGLPFIMLETQASSLPAVLSAGVPREVDFGLGLLHFVPLSDAPAVWAERVRQTHRTLLPAGRIRQTFTERGYHIGESVKTLEKIYENA